MTDKKRATIESGGVELKEEELDQVQAGAARAQRGTSSTGNKFAPRRTSSRVKFEIDLSDP